MIYETARFDRGDNHFHTAEMSVGVSLFYQTNSAYDNFLIMDCVVYSSGVAGQIPFFDLLAHYFMLIILQKRFYVV